MTIQDVFEAVGAHAAGRITDDDLADLENHACPGAGACGGQFTANTMATVCEFLGLSPMGSASVPAVDPARAETARAAGRLAMALVRGGPRPRQILTPVAIRNAIAAVAPPAGRPTPCCTCWPSRARRACRSTSRSSTASARACPVIADLKPAGRFVATDLFRAGGTRLVARRLIEGGFVDGGARTVSGRTLGEEAEAVEAPGQEVVRSAERPLQPTADWRSSPATSRPTARW